MPSSVAVVVERFEFLKLKILISLDLHLQRWMSSHANPKEKSHRCENHYNLLRSALEGIIELV